MVDVQTPVAMANASLFAPYEVSTWSSIPASQKAPNGAWVQDYGGYMSIGYDPTRFGKITSLNQLLSHKFAHSIALDGNPTQAPSALYGVMMVNLALGGTPGNLSAGVKLLPQARRRRQSRLGAGHHPADDQIRFRRRSSSTGTTSIPPRSSEDPLRRWKAFIPAGAAIGSFYAQAINKNAPHPAAARLWEEYLYSQTRQGRAEPLAQGRRPPSRANAMTADHKIDAKLAAPYPTFTGSATFLSAAQVAAAAKYLKTHWSKAVR